VRVSRSGLPETTGTGGGVTRLGGRAAGRGGGVATAGAASLSSVSSSSCIAAGAW
jgi:hypothetical protein